MKVRVVGGMRGVIVLVLSAVGCGDAGGGSTSETSVTSVPSTDPGTTTSGTDTPTTSSGTTTDSGVSATGSTTDAPTTGTDLTSGTSTGEPQTSGTSGTSAGTTGDDTTSEGDTEGVCMPEAVPDTLGFTYVRTIDIGNNIQGSFYNIEAQEMVFLTWMGTGKRVALDGTVLGDVAVPDEVNDVLDGATYDQVNETALIVDQECDLAEVDAVTLALLSSTKLDAKFGLDICSGLAIGLDGNLYITSTNSEEVVVITRDLQTEVRRFKVDDDGLTNVDGISLIAGSENFLVLSTYDLKAAIFDPLGIAIVPASTIGQVLPPLIGGDMPEIPDASLTVCSNGHAWVCEGLQKVGCYEYAPAGGDSDSCPCVIPQ